MLSTANLPASTARALRISAWICAVLAVVLWTGPSIIRPDLFDGDATQHVFWLYRYADPTLFPNDISIEYFASPSVAPLGYRALYAVLASSLDAQRVAEIVAAALLMASIALAWQLGAAVVEMARPMAGLIAVVVTIVLVAVNDLLPPMGFQRTFALPITLLCLWALVARRYEWVGISWLAAALFYPIMIPVLGITAGIVFLRDLQRERRLASMWRWNVVLGAIAIALVLLGSGTPENVGPMVTHAQALRMEEFGPAGRQDLFGPKSLGSYFWHHRTGLGWSPKLSSGNRCSGRTYSGTRATSPHSACRVDASGGGCRDVVCCATIPVSSLSAKPPFEAGACRICDRRLHGCELCADPGGRCQIQLQGLAAMGCRLPCPGRSRDCASANRGSSVATTRRPRYGTRLRIHRLATKLFYRRRAPGSG